MKPVYIWADGSVYPNPGKGGAGFVAYRFAVGVLKWTKIRSGSKGFLRTTNNRMEIMAVLLALQKCKPDELPEIYTDSQYVSEHYESLVFESQRGLWSIPNSDLWLRLGRVMKKRCILIRWSRGHSKDNPHNEEAHQLAYNAMKRGKLYPDKGFKEKK